MNSTYKSRPLSGLKLYILCFYGFTSFEQFTAVNGPRTAAARVQCIPVIMRERLPALKHRHAEFTRTYRSLVQGKLKMHSKALC